MVLALVASERTDCREAAMKSVGRKIGLTKWAVWGLAYGRRKSVAHATMQALRRAYLDYCERQIVKLEAQLDAAEMRSGDDDFRDLASEATRLVEKLREARKRAR